MMKMTLKLKSKKLKRFYHGLIAQDSTRHLVMFVEDCRGN